jgi:hypothetical protein
MVAICTLILTHAAALAVSRSYREMVPSWLGGMADKDITITFTPFPPGYVGPPLGFTAVYVTDNQVALDWSLGINAENTTIRAKMGAYPNDLTDGYVVFDGPGVSGNDTAVNFDVFLGIVHYRAWSENSTGGYSATYADAELESPHVSTIATLLTLLWPIPVLLGVVGIGYLFRASLFVMLAGFGFLIFGFTLWTTLSWLSIIVAGAGGLLIWLGAKS